MNGMSKREHAAEFFRQHKRPSCAHALEKTLQLNHKTASALVSILAKRGDIRSVRTGVCKYQGKHSHQHYVAKFRHFPSRQRGGAREAADNGTDYRAMVERKNRAILALVDELYGK